jgi:hypothetical protein
MVSRSTKGLWSSLAVTSSLEAGLNHNTHTTTTPITATTNTDTMPMTMQQMLIRLARSSSSRGSFGFSGSMLSGFAEMLMFAWSGLVRLAVQELPFYFSI